MPLSLYFVFFQFWRPITASNLIFISNWSSCINIIDYLWCQRSLANKLQTRIRGLPPSRPGDKFAEIMEVVRLETINYNGVGTEMPTVAPPLHKSKSLSPGKGVKTSGALDNSTDTAWEKFLSDLADFANRLQDFYAANQVEIDAMFTRARLLPENPAAEARNPVTSQEGPPGVVDTSSSQPIYENEGTPGPS